MVNISWWSNVLNSRAKLTKWQEETSVTAGLQGCIFGQCCHPVDKTYNHLKNSKILNRFPARQAVWSPNKITHVILAESLPNFTGLFKLLWSWADWILRLLVPKSRKYSLHKICYWGEKVYRGRCFWCAGLQPTGWPVFASCASVSTPETGATRLSAFVDTKVSF